MNIFVTGSAGYIGSHACLRLLEDGHRVVGVDNYCRGNRGATDILEQFKQYTFVEADIRNRALVEVLLADHQIEAVIHFAAFAYVGESCQTPLKYYDNNLGGSLSLLGAMGSVGVDKLVFSSTCATYGDPPIGQIPITESCAQTPISPYGHSKLMVERIIEDFAGSNESPEEFAFVILRYFNVAGADPRGRIGEVHQPETHLIPLCLKAALGHRDSIEIFGTDYPTRDGTCIRDYVHVIDLIDAHTQSLGMLRPGDRRYYNVGTGRGYSVREVVDACKHITAVDFSIREGARRSGDPPVLYADSSAIQNEIGWASHRPRIEEMITDAWRWMKTHLKGFDGD